MYTIISFMTDFGVSDTSVGQCKGVIAAISPKAQVIDITHAVPHFDIATGSWLLRNAAPYFPPCVHVAVVDPGVGTARRPVALECGRGDVLIGPDNGLLLATAQALGGITSAVQLANASFHHHPVSNTFHARDIFCPVAAHIIHGVGVYMFGPTLDAVTLVALPPPLVEVRDSVLHTAVMAINEFGSLALAAPGASLAEIGNPTIVQAQDGDATFTARVVRTFGEAAEGETILLIDSYARLCLAMNQVDLARSLGLARTDRPIARIQAVTGTTPAALAPAAP